MRGNHGGAGIHWGLLDSPFEILEQRGIRPCLVNARHMKNVPGRRTDWHECQWLQFLRSVGLLRATFRPGQDICPVRTLLRHGNELLSAASQHLLHMHKALTQMNLQIHHVISDITGVTGLAIVDAILAGQRDGAELAKLRDPHIKADSETIRKSLEGNIDRTKNPLPLDRKRNRAGRTRRRKNGHPPFQSSISAPKPTTLWSGCDKFMNGAPLIRTNPRNVANCCVAVIRPQWRTCSISKPGANFTKVCRRCRES